MMTKIEISFGSDSSYEDLSGRRWRLSSLTPPERRFLRSFVKGVNKEMSWPELYSSWRVTLLKLYKGLSRKDVVGLPLYSVCQDIESRVGIDQGFFRQRDYRDDLAEMIRLKFPSRYRFAKEVGIDEALLSRVVRKKAHLSIDKLESAIAPLGYRVALVRSSEPPRHVHAPSVTRQGLP
jgi:hypothetical protein